MCSSRQGCVNRGLGVDRREERKPPSSTKPACGNVCSWLFVGVLFGLNLLAGPSVSASSLDLDPEHPFDASQCSIDTKGKILVRLVSGYAFWFDPGTFMLRGGLEKPPATSGEPEGCPGNPVVTRAITFPFQYTEALKSKLQGRPVGRPAVRSLSLYGQELPLRLQDGDIRRHNDYKENGSICRVSREGVEVCLADCIQDPIHEDRCKVSGDYVVLLSDAASTGLAQPGAYVEYGGRRFAYSCLPRFSPNNPQSKLRSCSTAYQISKNLSVTYEFDSSQISEDEVLSLDRNIRTQIISARAPEYDFLQ